MNRDVDTTAPVSERLRTAILEGHFAPGQRLIEADLSAEFASPRAAVRSALLTLDAEGLVERLPNKGARVRSISSSEAVEIVEARVGLETLCARKAAERIGPAQIAELSALRAELLEAASSGDLLRYSDRNQHLDRRIRSISGHRTATRLLERLSAQSARHHFRLVLRSGRAQQSALEHAAIIDAVIAGDADAAESATRAHLLGIIDVLRSGYDAAEPGTLGRMDGFR